MIRFLSKARRKDLSGTAILRVDFNTEDDWRLKTIVPTVKFLLKAGCRVLILSHKGRPKGEDKKYSIKKESAKLGKFLGRKAVFINNFRFGEIRKTIDQAPARSVFVLENIRFLKGEENNDKVLAKKLAGLGDFYVNDAFAVSHREAASVCAITKFLPSFGGLVLEKEIVNLSGVLKSSKKPLTVIMGGGKAKDKLAVISNFKKKASWFLVGGTPANTLLWLHGFDIKKSVADREDRRKFAPFLKYSNILLPIDCRVRAKKIMDIGPRTESLFISKIKKSRTIIWNGPLGFFETKPFQRGTLAVVKAISENKKCFSLAGGGETVGFLKKYHFDNKFSFISTGGGAMLDFLAGKKLSGIEALSKSRK